MRTVRTIELDEDAAARVHYMLLVGLSAIGELDRLRWFADAYKDRLPCKDMYPLDPFADAEKIGKFADALRLTTVPPLDD